jgi:protein-S-isoprenylcysteine O-methyltransferase Ste14
VRYVAQRMTLSLVFALLLFGAAGTLHWPRGWAYVLSAGALEVVTLTLLARLAPETLRRRGVPGTGVKRFDRVFAALWLLLALAAPIVAGLDAVRFRWSTLSWASSVAGLLLLVAASALGDWAMVENEYFKQFVRIQVDRGHRVVTSGPYRVVRHPGYLAAILGAAATPLVLGSAWMFVPAGGIVALFVARTALEDRTLRRELAGYAEYAGRTRYRLLPWLW